MSINLPNFNLFQLQEQKLNLSSDSKGFELNVQCYNRFTGLLKILGIVEEIKQGKEVIHVAKTSLIKQYREQLKPQGLSDTEIVKIVHACVNEKSPSFPLDDISQPRITPDKKAADTRDNQSDPIDITTKDLNYRKINDGPLAGIVIESGTVAIAEKTEAHLKAEKVIDDIAIFLKSSLLEEKELELAIKNQYQMLKLMNSDGTWIDSEKLKNISSELLIPGKSRESCEKLIEEMAKAMKKNPYLLNCIANLPEGALKNFQEKLSSDNGQKMIKYLIPYAFALNSLTAVFAKDVELFNEVDKLWSKEKPFNAGNHLSFFGWIKYTTLGTLSRAKKPLQKHEIEKDANRHYLNLNIFEAVTADKYLKNNDNAKAGIALMRHPVGGKSDVRTGAGPTTVGVTKKEKAGEDSSAVSGKREYETYEIIKGRPDLPKEWADLYTVWNLAFISNGNDFPLLAMKLLIPSVNNYADDPQSYMHHRVIALYLHFQFNIFRQMADQQFDYLRDDWSSKEITEALGKANLNSSKEYETSVKKAKKNFPQ
jgi:hypothetical protein